MATRIISIKQGYSDGTLVLSQNNHSNAKRGETIKWHTDANSDVYSVEAIYEKQGSTNIFSIPPHEQGEHWQGDVCREAPYYKEYIYAIRWKGRWGTQVCDPKISIDLQNFFKELETSH